MARVRDLIDLEEAAAIGEQAGLPEGIFGDVARRGLVDVFERDGGLYVRRSEIERWCRAHGPRFCPEALRPAS